MATLEKLVRTVEALKLHQTPSVSLDETMTKKDKISHCVSVTDVLCSQVELRGLSALSRLTEVFAGNQEQPGVRQVPLHGNGDVLHPPGRPGVRREDGGGREPEQAECFTLIGPDSSRHCALIGG